ncbi:MAG: hypothetical protein HY913_04910 [Desulfomonile tiedjei]|nr:hypothetical protein [Desulfomonile tiedjei]
MPLLEFFNSEASLPYGLTTGHIYRAMTDFVDFLGLINKKLYSRAIPRLESIVMAANFSSIVGEFLHMRIPYYCDGLVRNRYHNGHPDLLPAGRFPGNSAQHAAEGIEVKASRHQQGWQGHNPEDTWLMVFVFDSNKQADDLSLVRPKPFVFREVLGARVTQQDWSFAGRKGTSRRTITASITQSGYEKMRGNWIYRLPDD